MFIDTFYASRNREKLKKTVKLGIIDLGTNSVRFDIYDVKESFKVFRTYSNKQMVRLGDNLFVKKSLDSEAMARALKAIINFKKKTDLESVDQIVAFATCALRESKNSNQFIKMVKAKTGIVIKVISGEEEARLIAKGVLVNAKTPKKEIYSLVDIGGGSTELSLCYKKTVIDSLSIPLGSNRLKQSFIRGLPASRVEVQNLKEHIGQVINKYMKKNNWPEVRTVIGSSGTIKAYKKILSGLSLGVQPMKVSSIKEVLGNLVEMNESDLLMVPGLEPKRVDIIVSGGILLVEVVNVLKSKFVYFSDYNLREGIIEQEIEDLIFKKFQP